MERYELERRIERIIENNIERYPYEGDYVKVSELKDDILNLIKEIKRENLVVKEHDIVRLMDGRRGTIVYIYNDNFFEVELSDNNEVLSISIKDIDEVE